MNTEYKFNTKTGICILNAEKIILKREGVTGQAANLLFGNSISRALSIYLVIGIIVIVIGIWSIMDKNYFSGGLFSIIGLICLGNVAASRNNSATNEIERSTVLTVRAHPPRYPFTRAYFTIHFLENGKKRKRFIFLPGSLDRGQDEFKIAFEAMKETGWYNN